MQLAGQPPPKYSTYPDPYNAPGRGGAPSRIYARSRLARDSR
jgi:hypothetical protein